MINILRHRYLFTWLVWMGVLFFLAACGPTVDQIKPQQTITINPTFQAQISPLPTAPAYRCGAWTQDNAPYSYATITIYARLTNKDIVGVSGATGTATVHFKSGDQTINEQPVSDNGGYVSFSLQLQGRQPAGIPATIDVTFSNFPGGTLKCSPAFFTPQ